jgi:WD40 repeat protein
MTVLAGDQVGEYRLVRKLGGGAHGTVYQAEHVLLGTQVAIKVLHGQLTSATLLALRAEAIRQARLEHRYIVPVLAYAEQPIPYLAMKYAPNGTLKQHYPKGQRLPLETILPHVCQIAEGLQYAHDHQTLHLDLKPSNVLLGKEQEALISDFGVSLILHQQKTHQTVGNIAGTPAYMAPEQLLQKPEKASDQYALAVMVYQWLTGTLPFTGDVWSIGLQKLSYDPLPLRRYVPNLPPAVEEVVLQALSREPNSRFSRVQAFANALTDAIPAQPQQRAVPVSPQTVPLRPPPEEPPRPPIGTLIATFSARPRPANLESGSLQSEAPAQVLSVAWSPDGTRLAWASTMGSIWVGEVASKRLLANCQGHTGPVSGVAWSPDGTRLVSCAGTFLGMQRDNTVRVWEAASGRLLFTCKGHTGNVNGVAWSPDGTRLASASNDNTVRVWEAASGRLLFTCQWHTGPVKSVAWSPDGTRLASANSDQTVRVWEAASGVLLLTRQGHTATVWDVAWSPDGSRLASCSGRRSSRQQENSVEVWEATSGKLLLTCQGHHNLVDGVVWATHGRSLASASKDKTVRIWDAASGFCAFIYQGHSEGVKSVAWSPDGRCIASASGDETVQVWSAG